MENVLQAVFVAEGVKESWKTRHVTVFLKWRSVWQFHFFPSHLKYFTPHPDSFLLSSSAIMLRSWQKRSNKFLAIFVSQLWSI